MTQSILRGTLDRLILVKDRVHQRDLVKVVDYPTYLHQDQITKSISTFMECNLDKTLAKI